VLSSATCNYPQITLLRFASPFLVFVVGGARDFKFGKQIEHKSSLM